MQEKKGSFVQAQVTMYKVLLMLVHNWGLSPKYSCPFLDKVLGPDDDITTFE